jgi:hypothetical protein
MNQPFASEQQLNHNTSCHKQEDHDQDLEAPAGDRTQRATPPEKWQRSRRVLRA